MGIIFTSRLSFQSTFLDLANRARKGISAITRTLWSLGEHSPKVFFKLFDAQIQPILTFGAEIWGLTRNQEVIERVHLCALKRFMCVSQRAPRHLIYGELGRYPLQVVCYTKCIKFWLRLVTMSDSRFPKKAYNTLLFLQSRNYSTWACNVRNVLYMYGYGIVWEAQSVGNSKAFISQFRQRLIDCYAQEWDAKLDTHSFYQVYSSYGRSLALRHYFCVIKNINVRKIFTRFRLGMLPLRNRFLKYNNMRKEQNIFCPFCDGFPETEVHFILVCPKYADLREQFLPRKFFNRPSVFKMALLLSNPSDNLIMQSAMYVFKAYKRRNDDLQ